jgi:hypothetical protein
MDKNFMKMLMKHNAKRHHWSKPDVSIKDDLDYCVACGICNKGGPNKYTHEKDYPNAYLQHHSYFKSVNTYLTDDVDCITFANTFSNEFDILALKVSNHVGLQVVGLDSPHSLARLCPNCGFKYHLEFQFGISHVTFDCDMDLSNDTLSFAGPVAAALLWIQEEVGEMEESVFAGKFPDAIDAVFDILGVIIILMGWVASEFSCSTLRHAYASYEWDQLKRGRDTKVFHQLTIEYMIDSIITSVETGRDGDLNADILINAMRKRKRRELVVGVFSRYLRYLNHDS